MVLKWSTFKFISSDPNLHPRWPPSADIVYIGPYGKYVQKSSPETSKPIKANMAWVVLKWSLFKIVAGDPDLHPRWPRSVDIVLT